MKMKHFLLLNTILLSFIHTVPAQSLQFYREDIVFKLTEDRMETDAVYYFCNVGDKDLKTMLLYPFPENTMELIDSICIREVSTGKSTGYIEGRSAIRFEISVSAYGQSAYQVIFRQKLVEKRFKYILTSTQAWGRPLEYANFELQAPAEFIMDSLSYPPDNVFIQQHVRYYLWKKKDFMPDKDFELKMH